MNLRRQAAADLQQILEDDEHGFGWQLELTDPSGRSATLVGSSGDVSATIDPSTGAVLEGTYAHVVVALASLANAGCGVPQGSVDTRDRPWLVAFEQLDGKRRKFAVQVARPDRTLGIVTLVLSPVADA